MGAGKLFLAALGLSLAGCAALQAQDTQATEQMLAAAGFQAKAADTPQKVAHLQALAPRKIVRRERNGEPSYVYADPDGCKCLYTGTEPQYQEYRKLVRQQTMADEATVVTEQTSDPGSWGLWGLWP
jgi:hypothetical protein